MMKLIIASTEDPAAENISARLLEFYDFEKYPDTPDSYVCGQTMLVKMAGDVTQITSLPTDADEVMVASRHVSESGKPSLTVHVPGELKKLELAIASPSTVKSALRALTKARDEIGLPHEVSLEATHHGPTKLGVPITFVEIGGTASEWKNEKAGEAVARAMMEAANSHGMYTNAVGFGGPHYAPQHTKIVLSTDIAVGHVLPKYSNFDERLIEQAVLRTAGDVTLFLLDWKGMNKYQREVCLKVAKELGIKTARVGKILHENPETL
ncbi:MAG: hypothetical protein DRN83_03600 [Hadesarchaea archaeon]|nr:MAG: hypothetical protein DRN83_03600 [Hadesarchaea archaeon]